MTKRNIYKCTKYIILGKMVKKKRENKRIDENWVNIRITREMKFWLMSEKARRKLLTYDQVLREVLTEVDEYGRKSIS